jgi:hypothetical protein
MDIQPQTTKPISDDQELAKVLAGITQKPNDLDFEELEAPGQTNDPNPFSPTNPLPIPEPAQNDDVNTPTPAEDKVIDVPTDSPDPITETPSYNNESNDLESIKKTALIELRPLVDKLELAPDEKFNIYLLLLRSTDDKTLIAPAHKAAADITDESKRAQALLDVIKEIDYLSVDK